MANGTTSLRGVVHGRTISLDTDAGLPDGQVVSVTLIPALPPGRGLERAFGSWAEESDELDSFLEDLRRDRKQPRPEPGT